MVYRNLDEYLIRLEQSGELIHIAHLVQPDLEISAITQRVQTRAYNRALWFDHVGDSTLPVVTNLFGTSRRMAWALGTDKLADLPSKLDALLAMRQWGKMSFGGLITHGMQTLNALRNAIGNDDKPNAPVQAVIYQDAPDLGCLPILRHWEGETTPNITGAQLYTIHPHTGEKAVHWARAIVINPNTLGILVEWETLMPHHPTPAAIVLGGDPATMWSASVPLPNGIIPYWVSGWLRNKPIPFTRAISQPISVPADAEIIIEGWLEPSAIHQNHTLAGYKGTSIQEATFIQFHVTAITHRQDAVYPAFVPTPIGAEYSQMVKAGERLFLPLLQAIFTEICDMALHDNGDTAVISIKARPHGYAHKIMYGIWGLGHLATLHKVVIVDESVNIHDNEAVATIITTHANPDRDIIRVNGLLPKHHPSAISTQFGMKIGIDATAKRHNMPLQTPYEGQSLSISAQLEAHILHHWKRYGLK